MRLRADQSIDNATDRRDIHGGQSAELILRAGADLRQFRNRSPLRLRQIHTDVTGKEHRVTLGYLAQNESDLVFKHVTGRWRFPRTF